MLHVETATRSEILYFFGPGNALFISEMSEFPKVMSVATMQTGCG